MKDYRQYIQIHVQILQNEVQPNNNVSVLKNICDHICLDRNQSGVYDALWICKAVKEEVKHSRILVLGRDKGNKCSGNLIKWSGWCI